MQTKTKTKDYAVDLTINASAYVRVEASNNEQAKNMAIALVEDNLVIYDADHYSINAEIDDIQEVPSRQTYYYDVAVEIESLVSVDALVEARTARKAVKKAIAESAAEYYELSEIAMAELDITIHIMGEAKED